MNVKPPRWVDRFLEWYCRPEILEEIQGDAHELFYRNAKKNLSMAKALFAWNVIRFFRLKNIRGKKNRNDEQIPLAMIKNILLVSLRNFFRQPGHSFLSVFGLMAGFICTFLILLWVSHEFSYDQFHEDKDKIYKVITHVNANGNVQTYDVASVAMDVSSVPEVDALVSISTGTRWPNELCFRPEAKPTECVYFNGIYANENLFSAFSFSIIQGDHSPLKENRNIAISQRMANALYGDANPLGKTMKIDGWQDVTVASVFKDVPVNSSIKFDFALPYFIWKKLRGMDDNNFNENFFNVYIKTSVPATAGQLTAKLNDVRVLTEKNISGKVAYEAVPFTDWHLKSKYENGKNTGGRIDYVVLFFIIGTLVVMMAIINFINLSTARASLRAKEIGIRKVTGALRGTIIFQFIGEAFIIVLLAFLLAAVATQLLLPAFSNLIGEQLSLNLFNKELVLDLFGLLLLVSFIAGIYPAFVLSSFQPVKILKGQFSSGANGSLQLRKLLMIAQLSISTAIVIFSGVLFLQMNYIIEKDLGFDRSNIIRLEPTWTLLKSYDNFKNQLVKNPSIVSVGGSLSNILSVGGGNSGVEWPGKPKDLRISFKTIGAMYDFPETIGLKILEGRGFVAERGGKDSLATDVLVTKDAAAVMGLKNPLGEKIKIGFKDCVIVGIVNDFHTASLKETREPVIIYQTGIRSVAAIYIKYKPGEVKQAMQTLDAAYKNIETSFTMRYWFQDDTFDGLYKTERTASQLVLIFTLIALLIAVIGIVGLATFNVMRRTKEIGIRRVLGATTSQVMTLLSGEFGIIILLAITIGIPSAWYASNEWLSGFAYHITMPWWVYLSALAFIVLLTVGIICTQGLKVIMTNPTEVLRSE
jgi:putative ABC transport system permease protein